MGLACSMHGKMRTAYKIFGRKTRRDYSEDLGIDGNMILLGCILEK
jgi:hypothetical protein